MMTKKELLATLRPYVAPAPDKDTQQCRAILAVNVAGELIRTIDEGIRKDAERGHKIQKKDMEKFQKLSRWHAECALQFKRLPRHNASLRICKQLQTGLHTALLKRIIGPQCTTEDTYAAWAQMAWGILLDAENTAKDVCQGRKWKFFAQTMGTIAKDYEKISPKGAELGYKLYCETPTA